MTGEWRGDAYNTYTNVSVRNDFSTSAVIGFAHRYSDGTPETAQWELGPGEVGAPMSVGYNTGFGRVGTDWWSANAETADGFWDMSQMHACQLTSGDANQTLVFSVGPNGGYGVGLSMNIPSGNCWAEMTQTGFGASKTAAPRTD